MCVGNRHIVWQLREASPLFHFRRTSSHPRREAKEGSGFAPKQELPAKTLRLEEGLSKLVQRISLTLFRTFL
jgi:hypothetical protein